MISPHPPLSKLQIFDEIVSSQFPSGTLLRVAVIQVPHGHRELGRNSIAILLI